MKHEKKNHNRFDSVQQMDFVVNICGKEIPCSGFQTLEDHEDYIVLKLFKPAMNKQPNTSFVVHKKNNAKCKNCGTTLQKSNQRFCSAKENPECQRTRLQSNRFRNKTTQKDFMTQSQCRTQMCTSPRVLLPTSPVSSTPPSVSARELFEKLDNEKIDSNVFAAAVEQYVFQDKKTKRQNDHYGTNNKKQKSVENTAVEASDTDVDIDVMTDSSSSSSLSSSSSSSLPSVSSESQCLSPTSTPSFSSTKPTSPVSNLTELVIPCAPLIYSFSTSSSAYSYCPMSSSSATTSESLNEPLEEQKHNHLEKPDESLDGKHNQPDENNLPTEEKCNDDEKKHNSRVSDNENDEEDVQEINCDISTDEEDRLYDCEDNRDKIVWKGTRKNREKRIVYYNYQGEEMEQYKEGECRFIATYNGTLLSDEHPGLICVEFLNVEGDGEFAPGNINCFMQVKHPNKEVIVDIEWMKKSDQYFKKAYKSNVNFFEYKRHTMPLSTIWGRVDLMPQKKKKSLMSKYAMVLAEFDKQHQYGLGTYSQCVKNPLPPGQTADLFDLLEFYHVKDKWLWRTNVGVYIYNNFIEHVEVFGHRKRNDIIQHVLTSKQHPDYNTGEKINYAGPCQACDKPHVIQHKFTFSNLVLNTGCVCARRIQYLLQIGFILHNFRDAEKFNAAVAVCLFSEMQSQKRRLFLDEQEFQNKFHS